MTESLSNFTFGQPVASFELAAASGLTIVTGLLLIPTIITLLRYRQHDLIKYRNVETLIPCLLYFFVVMLLHTLSMGLGKPVFCTPLNVLMAAVFYFITHFMLLSPSVVFHSQLNARKTISGDGAGNSSHHDNYHDSLYWRFIKAFIAVPMRLILTFIIGTVYLILYLPTFYLAGLNGDCLRSAIITSNAYTLLFAIILSYLTLKLNSVKEVFFLRLEIMTVLIVTTPVQLTLGILYSFVPQLFPDWFDIRWVFLSMGLLTTLVNGVFPCCLLNERFHRLMAQLVYHNMLDEHQRGKVNNKLSQLNVEDVIAAIFNNEILLKSFQQFAEDNWSVENVLFYQEVKQFRLDFDGMKYRNNRVQSIYDDYIRSGARLEVNLSFSIKKQIRDAVMSKDYSVDMFDEAQHQIKVLMHDDTFYKWRKTDSCRAAFAAALGNSDSSLSNSLHTTTTTATTTATITAADGKMLKSASSSGELPKSSSGTSATGGLLKVGNRDSQLQQ